MRLICTGLPPRQSQVIELAAQGYSEKMTAREMGCSIANVEGLRRTVFYKWNAQNITAAIAEGFKRGHLQFLPVLALCMLSMFNPDQTLFRPVKRQHREVISARVVNQRDLGRIV